MYPLLCSGDSYLGTKHAFIYRMIFISFHRDFALPVPADNNTATYAAITAGATVTARRKFIMLMIACHG